MPTPIFQNKVVSLSTVANSPVAFEFVCNDATGAPVDISSGYLAYAWAQSNSSHLRGAQIAVPGTYTYGSTGKLTLSMVSSDTFALPAGEALPINVFLSNDSGVTHAMVANGVLKINQSIN